MTARVFPVCVLALAVCACATDPFEARLAEPRLGAAGWVAVEELDAADADPAFDAGAREAAEALDAKLDVGCAEPRTSTVRSMERLAASDAALTEIARGEDVVVRQRVAVSACGETRLHAVYASRDAAGGPVFLTGVPGGSVASLGLQRDVIDQVVVQAAGIIASGHPAGSCDAAVNEPWVLDTALAEPPRKGQWSERWTVGACGERRTITVAFEETATGTRFSSPIALAEE
jgi:hypothetical protein